MVCSHVIPVPTLLPPDQLPFLAPVHRWTHTSRSALVLIWLWGCLILVCRRFHPACSAPLSWDLSTPSGLRGACFWMRDKRRMPLNDARPEINERYSQGEQGGRLLVLLPRRD